jgi:hypothetical protein
MDLFTRVLCLFAVGFALTLTPLGEKSAEQPASDGVTVSAVTDALFATQPLAAQNGNGNGGGGPGEVVCSWCEEFAQIVYPGIWAVKHKFFDEEGDRCAGTQDPTEDNGTVYCRRCGGTSLCHTSSMDGLCHEECGGENGNGNGNGNGPDLASAARALEAGFQAGDMVAVAEILRSSTGGHSGFQYLPEAGRIVLSASCNPGRPVAMFPVALEVRPALEALLYADEG